MTAKAKRNLLLRVLIYGGLLTAAVIALRMRACPTWTPAAVTETYQTRKPNPYIDPEGQTQETRILPPEGFARTEAAEGSFTAFMRQQPVYGDGSMIYVYDGSQRSGAGAAAVYDLSVGAEGYQECADSIIRLWSEYFRGTGQEARLSYHLSNGFLCDWASWKRGKRVLAFGDWAMWLPLSLPDDSEQQFHNYLVTVMRYAGTLSLEAESEPIDVSEAHPGDILCHGGAPGHAVLIADEAVNAAGERCFLLAQGFIPAQSCQILAGYAGAESPWYSASQLTGDEIRLEGYTFHGDGILRRWNGGFS